MYIFIHNLLPEHSYNYFVYTILCVHVRVVAGRIDDNSVQIEYAAVYHFLNFGYQRYDFFAKKTRIRQRITYILVKYHLRKVAVFQN